MKKKFLTIVLTVAALLANATPVLFTLQSLTGSVNNRSILVQPDKAQNPLVLGTNLIPLYDFTLQPTNGMVLTNLASWGYTITVSGWPRSAHINVPSGTNTVNAATLINTNAFSPLIIQAFADNTTATNVNLKGAFTDPNGFPLAGTNFVLQGGNAATLVTPTLVGEVGDPLLNPTNLNSIATATDSYNSTFYTVFSGVAPVADNGAGFFSGENFQVVAPSNLGFGVWVSTNANAAFNQWNYFGGCVEFSNGNGTSRYGTTLTQAVSSYYIFRQTAGTPVFQKYVSIAAGSSSAGLGFTPDGNFADLNLVWNGVVVLKWMAQGGVSLNSGTTGNNALAGWPYGVTIGDGQGGASGTFFGTNGYANFMGIVTNGGLVWYSLKTNATPAIAAPSGSICTTTNGQLYVRSNSVWLLK